MTAAAGPSMEGASTEHMGTGTGRVHFVRFILILSRFSSGFFAASEMAVVTQNDNKIRQMAESGHASAKRLLRFVGDKSRFLSTIQVAITLAGFLSSAFAADKLALRLYAVIDPSFLHPSLRTLMVVLMTIVLSYFTLVLGELVPKRLAMRRPEQFAMSISAVLRFFDIAFRPFTKLLEWSSNAVLRLMGIDRRDFLQCDGREYGSLWNRRGLRGSYEVGDADQNIFAFDDNTSRDRRRRIDYAVRLGHHEEAVGIAANASFALPSTMKHRRYRRHSDGQGSAARGEEPARFGFQS